MQGPLKVFCGRANPALGAEICEHLRQPTGKIDLYDFPDGETCCQLKENVRGADVFVVQPTTPPAHKNLMEMLILLETMRRSSARRITAVLPYFAYARQDRKDKPRVPITSKLVANLLTTAGAQRILALDLHAPQIQGFFDVPVDHLFAVPVILDEFRRREFQNVVIVSPDAGGVERARAFATRCNAELAIIDKRKADPKRAVDKVEVMNVVGDVEGKTAVLVDDMLDTGSTIMKASHALLAQGAASVYAACTHALLSGEAASRLNDSPIRQVFITNTIDTADKQKICPKLVPLSVAELLAKAIWRIHEDDSVSSLFV
jgi:ribose-phosphate pyrophosphokinase